MRKRKDTLEIQLHALQHSVTEIESELLCIGNQAVKAQTTPAFETREQKIARLKREIATGTYRVDSLELERALRKHFAN